MWSGVFALFALVIVLAVPTLKKAKWVAIFAVSTMFVACVVIVVLSGYFAAKRECSSIDVECSQTCQTDVALGGFGTTFSVYSFAFSVHVSMANYFHALADPSAMYKAQTLTYSGTLLLFGIPLCVVPYAEIFVTRLSVVIHP